MRYIPIILLCAASIFLKTDLFIDPYIVPKWYATLFCLIILGIVLLTHFLFKKNHTTTNGRFVIWNIRIIVIICSLQALLGLLQYLEITGFTGNFRLTGSFDNPAGLASSLSVAFPLFLILCMKEVGWIKGITIFVTLLIFITMCLSESRAGIITLCVISIIFGFKYSRSSRNIKILGLCFFCFLFIGLYFLKKDSADGRILIWKCSWNMFVDKPLWGRGKGGFEANYMDYQAAYFNKNPESKYRMLADTVQQPFSEYIRLAIDYGIAGILLFFLFCGFIIYCMFRNRNIYNEVALGCLISIAILSLFSYPLMYPFVWLILVQSCIIIIRNAKFRIRMNFATKKWIYVSIFPLIIYSGFHLTRVIKAEIEWKRAFILSQSGLDKKALSLYKDIYRTLNTDRYFMYNFSVVLFQMGQYDESLNIAQKCRKLWADYDLEMLIANIYSTMDEYKKADGHYRQAAFMCPNRFMPLYQRVLLLDKMGKKCDAKLLAKSIVNKPIKINSNIITQIKNEMAKYE